jgi:hypothetical protein
MFPLTAVTCLKLWELAMLRGLTVWLLIMALETVHGILRGMFLVPITGQVTANRVGWPIAAVIVMGISVACAKWIGLYDIKKLILLGLFWAMLTFIFELAIGFARGLSGYEIIAEINPLAGGLLIYSLIVMLFAPWLATKIRGM